MKFIGDLLQKQEVWRPTSEDALKDIANWLEVAQPDGHVASMVGFSKKSTFSKAGVQATDTGIGSSLTMIALSRLFPSEGFPWADFQQRCMYLPKNMHNRAARRCTCVRPASWMRPPWRISMPCF